MDDSGILLKKLALEIISMGLYFTKITSVSSVIKEELYQGTAKGSEGYAANCTFSEARKEGMNIEVHWQDADSSSSNAVAEHFPKAKVMICGGRAHEKQLEKLAKLKSFSDDFKRKHESEFPTVNEVACCCSSRHRPGCGCMTEAFVERARNNFLFILCVSRGVCKTHAKTCT